MKQALIIELITQLNQKEQKEISAFLKSPYFNNRMDLQKLFDVLVAYIHDLDVLPNPQQVFKKLFPDKAFNNQLIRLLFSYLLKKIEHYLTLKEMEHQGFETKHFLLSAYRKKGLQRHFTKTLKQKRNQLQKQQLRHPEYYFSFYELEQEAYLWESSIGRSRAHNLQVQENYLHYGFLSMKLRQACFSLAHQTVYKTTYQLGLIDEILKEISVQPELLKIPAISVYVYCYQALSHPNHDATFKEFKKHLFQYIKQFPKGEMRDLFLLAINYGIRKINENNTQFLTETFELYKKALENKLLLDHGHISRFTYDNVVRLALRIWELDWADWFVNSYKRRLEIAYREATFSLSAAQLEYSRNDYKKALLYLQKVDYKDTISHMVAKTLQLKIYFELKEYNLLDSHLKSMRNFIRRNKHLGYHQKNYLNIIQISKSLMRVNPYSRAEKMALQKEIETMEPLAEKKWWLEQLDKL